LIHLLVSNWFEEDNDLGQFGFLKDAIAVFIEDGHPKSQETFSLTLSQLGEKGRKMLRSSSLSSSSIIVGRAHPMSNA